MGVGVGRNRVYLLPADGRAVVILAVVEDPRVWCEITETLLDDIIGPGWCVQKKKWRSETMLAPHGAEPPPRDNALLSPNRAEPTQRSGPMSSTGKKLLLLFGPGHPSFACHERVHGNRAHDAGGHSQAFMLIKQV